MTEAFAQARMMVQTWLSTVTRREDGQDMIEYALLAALIAIAAIAVIVFVGPELQKLFQDVINALQNA
jgi:pilus assembly protein Flp/PilA